MPVWGMEDHMEPVRRQVLLLAGATLIVGMGSAIAEPVDQRSLSGIERATRATVGILQPGEDAHSPGSRAHFMMRGTGVHLRDGYILTARHVVERDEDGKKVLAKQVSIMTAELEEGPATLTGGSAFLDVAVYRVSADISARLPTVSLAESEPVSGDEVFTVGYPLGWGPAIGFGRVGNPNTFLPTVETRLFQLDLSACSGSSGGGLFNAKAELVGVVHAVIQTETAQEEPRCSRFGFAVPGVLVRRVVTALTQGAQPSFSKLGVSLAPVRIGSRWRVSVSDATGPAREGGLQKGDVLLALEDTEITDAAQLKTYLIERTRPGQRVAVRVLRGLQEHVLHVTLGTS